MKELAVHRRPLQQLATAALSDPGSRLAISGATGWLGRALANMASRAGLQTTNGRLRLFASRDGCLPLATEERARVEALSTADRLIGPGWRIAHFAALGKERSEDLSPEDFLAEAATILDHMLDIACRADQPRMIFSSSGTVYSATDDPKGNPYGHSKRRAEERLCGWCAHHHAPLLIARVFNVGGPFGNKVERYALSSMLNVVLKSEPIRIRARMPVFRSYVHVEEILALLLHLAGQTDDAGPAVFDSCGREIVELGDLARVIVNVAGRGAEHDIERLFDPRLAADWYVGDPRDYQLQLVRAGLTPTGLVEIIRDAAAHLMSEEPRSGRSGTSQGLSVARGA